MAFFSKEKLAREPLNVGIVGFDGVATLDLAGPLEAFARVHALQARGETRRYEVVLLGASGKSFVSDGGAVFRAPKTLATAPVLDTVIVPGGSTIRTLEVAQPIADWLTRHAASVRRLVFVSSGIYAATRTGLLDGHQVTTHWRYTQALAREFPSLRVNPAAPFVRDGGIYSCGGGTASIEMTLALIEEDYGSQVALAAARELVMELKAPAGAEAPVANFDYQVSPREKLADIPAWIATHLRDNLSVEALARHAMMCPRHFSRLFKEMFRVTPADFVEQLRLDEARRRLQSRRHSIESIAAAVGFKSGDSFRRVFERRLGMTPRDFRNMHHRPRENAARETALAA